MISAHKRNGVSILPIISLMLIGYIIMRMNLVLVRDLSIFNYTYVFVAGVVLLGLNLLSGNLKVSDILSAPLIWLLVFSLYIFLLTRFTEVPQDLLVTKWKTTLILYALYMVYCVLNTADERNIRIVHWSTLLFLAISIGYTLYVLSIYPNAVRNTAFGAYVEGFTYRYAEFGFCYALLLWAAAYGVMLSAPQTFHRRRLTLFILLIVGFSGMSGYTTAFILVLLLLGYVFLFRTLHIRNLFILVFVIMLFYALVFSDILPDMTKMRLQSLMSGGSGTMLAEYAGRVAMSNEMWKLFLEAPLFGHLWAGQITKYVGHAEWLNNLAMIGLVGTLPIVLLFYSIYRRIMRDLLEIYGNHSVQSQAVRMMFICFALIGFLNPMDFSQMGAPLLLAPIVLRLYSQSPKLSSQPKHEQ